MNNDFTWAKAKMLMELDEMRDSARLTKAISARASVVITKEVSDLMVDSFKGCNIVGVKKYASIRRALEGADKTMDLYEISTLEEPESWTRAQKLKKSKAEIAAHSAEWARWKLLTALPLLRNNYDLSNKMIGKKKFAKGLNKTYKALLTLSIRAKKNIGFIQNSCLNSVARANDFIDSPLADEWASFYLDVLVLMGLLRIDTVWNEETDAHEKMVHVLDTELPKLRDIKRATSARFVKLAPPVSVLETDKDIVIKKRYPYVQPIATHGDAVDILNGVDLELLMSKEELDSYIWYKVFGRFGEQEVNFDSLKNNEKMAWVFDLREDMHREYDYITHDDIGNVFNLTRDSDGVARYYEKSEHFGFHQNTKMRHAIGLKNKLLLDENGKRTIRLEIAAKMGYDKVTGRVAYRAFFKNQDEWRKDEKVKHLFAILDKPYAPTGHLTELDAQTQGTQVYALLGGSMSLAVISGLYGDTFRSDGYISLSDEMNFRLGVDVFTRSACKSPFMLSNYSAKYKTLMFGSKYDEESGLVKGANWKQVPLMETAFKALDEDGNQIYTMDDTKDIWVAFRDSMKKLTPRAIAMMESIEKAAKVSPLKVVDWVMPDGVQASVAMQKTIEKHINWISPDGKVHTLKHHKTILVAGSKATAWAPRIVQSVDAYILREMTRRLNALGIELVAIHDAYLTHPNFSHIVMRIYREVCADILDMNLLSDIMFQITGSKFDFQAASRKVDRAGNNDELTAAMILNESLYGVYL